MKNRIDWKYFIYFIGLIVLCLISYFYKDSIFISIEKCLTHELTYAIIGAWTFVSTILYKIKHGNVEFKVKMSFSDFRTPFEDFIGLIINPISFICALSLAKGLFLQLILKKGSYFGDFSTIEISFFIPVTAYLLYESILHVYSMTRDLLIRKDEVKPEAVSEFEFINTEK